jgi:nicotinamidase-related amidase
MPETPLLIIDAQVGFVNDNSRCALDSIEALAQHWLAQNQPVYMSQFVNSPASKWRSLIHWSRLAEEDEIAITPQLSAIAERATPYRKATYSSIVGPMREGLEREGWAEVVLCGIATDGCVLATAIELFDRWEGVRPRVVSDACASHAGEAVHEAGLLLISRFIGRDQIVDSSSLLVPARHA